MKILVVEDESSIAENISYALSTEGYEPVLCETGKDALELLDAQNIGAIIVDIGLPDISGFDLVREIRKKVDTPVLFLTARTSEIDRVVGLEIGADDYVTKPFSPRELVARIRAVLRRASSQMNDQKRVPESFIVDEKRCMISYYGESLELSRYEYRILKTLIENPGRVFSREQLMSRSWEAPDMSLERTVDTHIKTIRRKLKAVRPGADPISTHRGFGYSLDISIK